MTFKTRQTKYRRKTFSTLIARSLWGCALALCSCQNDAALKPVSSTNWQADAPVGEASDAMLYTPWRVFEDTDGRDYKSALLVELFVQSVAMGAANGAQSRLRNVGMPKNARQTTEGYWLGAQPKPNEIDELYARNIRVVITAAAMETETFRAIKSKLNDYGMVHINIPFGGKFPNPKAFHRMIHTYEPDQIYIHCEHGGDRSGAILAYLLVIDHGWTIPHALLAVAFPGKNDSKRLIELLRKRGFDVEQPDIDDYLGIYSAETNGGYGGLKVRSSGYVKLVNTTIDAALRELKYRM